MTDLFKAYIYRLRKSKVFWVFTILVIAFSILYSLFAGVFTAIYKSNSANGVAPQARSSLLISICSPFSIPFCLLYLFQILFFGSEWKNDTYRNSILSGKKRSQIYNTAFLLGIIIYFIYLIICIIPIYTITYCFPMKNLAEAETSSLNLFYAFIILVLSGILMTSLSIFSVFVVHNRFIAIAIVIGFYLVCMLTNLLLNYSYLMTPKIDGKVFSVYQYQEFLLCYQVGCSSTSNMFGYGNTTLDVAVKYIFKATEYGNIRIDTNTITGRAPILLIKSIGMDIIFTALFYGFGLLGFKKRDLR